MRSRKFLQAEQATLASAKIPMTMSARSAGSWPGVVFTGPPLNMPAGQFGFSDARNVLGFVDGHVSSVKMYRNPSINLPSCNYEPPAGYEYKWHAD